MPFDDELFAQALDLLQTYAVDDGDDRVVTDPWSILESAGIARDVVADLVRQRRLVGLGRMRFRIVQEIPAGPKPRPATHLAPPNAVGQPSFLLVIDAENFVHGCANAGTTFEPARVFETARQLGAVAFAFALGNFRAIPPDVLERLKIAGADIVVNVHCPRLRDGNGGKDTTDETLQALVQRHLRYSRIHGVIFVTDDRNFAPIMNAVLDTRNPDDNTRMRCIRISFRRESMLDAIGEVIRLTDNGKPDRAPPRRWAPDIILEDLRTLPTLPEDGRPAVLRSISIRAPLVQRLLRALIRKYFCRVGRATPVSFKSLLDLFVTRVRPEDRDDVSDDELHAFLTALIDAGVLTQQEVPQRGGSLRTRYQPNWTHPFCVEAVSDIPACDEWGARSAILSTTNGVRDDQQPRASPGHPLRRHDRRRSVRRAAATETAAEE